MLSRIEHYILLAVTILFYVSCQTKIFTYERNTKGLSERFIVNYSKNQFEYYADSASLNYHANGTSEIHKDMLQFEFPEHAEAAILSPFKKGYFTLVKLSDSDSFELNTNFYNVTYGHEMGINRHFKPNFEILNFIDSSIVQKVPFPTLKYYHDSDSLLIKTDVPEHFNQLILIPEKGKYQLSLHLQSPLTVGFYETTTTTCNFVMSKPTFLAKIILVRKDSILSFRSIDGPYGEYKLNSAKGIKQGQ